MNANNIILLVEDNPYDANLTIRALEKAKVANKIILAKDGAEALDYDGIVCDVVFDNISVAGPWLYGPISYP